MRYRELLTRMLSEAFTHVASETAGLVLELEDRSVSLVATEADVAACAHHFANDGLLALGAIHDDTTGLTAGVGLLAIHIEELVGSDPAVTWVEVTPTGLRSSRTIHPEHESPHHS